VPGYDSWWDVAVAEVSEQDSVKSARDAWQAGRTRQRYFL
jgi:3D-(3,5/4)-trihydroxycyclohexane-1,2-dione acylhydrolase (decyclizing)